MKAATRSYKIFRSVPFLALFLALILGAWVTVWKACYEQEQSDASIQAFEQPYDLKITFDKSVDDGFYSR